MPEIVIKRAKTLDAEKIHQVHVRSIRKVSSKDQGPDEIGGWGKTND